MKHLYQIISTQDGHTIDYATSKVTLAARTWWRKPGSWQSVTIY